MKKCTPIWLLLYSDKLTYRACWFRITHTFIFSMHIHYLTAHRYNSCFHRWTNSGSQMWNCLWPQAGKWQCNNSNLVLLTWKPAIYIFPMMTANIYFDISKRKIPLFWDRLKRHAQEFYFLSGASTPRQLCHLPSCSNTVPFLYRDTHT